MLKRYISLVFVLLISCSFLSAKDYAYVEKKALKAIDRFESVWKYSLDINVKQEPNGKRAITFCSNNIQGVTKSISDEFANVDIRRTSLKYRNPINKPDSLDEKVLKEFDEISLERKIPDIKVVETKNSYRVYKPLVILTPICLKCHGDVNKIKPSIKEVLNRRYPNDKAVNFKYKNVRGAIVATIKK